MAQARLAESRAVFDERKLDRYPTVPADASYTYAKQQVPGSFNNPATINTFRSGFDAYWETDLFGRVRHSVAAAASDNQAVEADLHDVGVSVVAELARNYFELRGIAVASRSGRTKPAESARDTAIDAATSGRRCGRGARRGERGGTRGGYGRDNTAPGT